MPNRQDIHRGPSASTYNRFKGLESCTSWAGTHYLTRFIMRLPNPEQGHLSRTLLRNALSKVFDCSSYPLLLRSGLYHAQSVANGVPSIVIVGAGAAGRVLGGKLTEDENTSVLLLEAVGGNANLVE